MHLCWPIADEGTVPTPLRLSFKSKAGRQENPTPGGGPMAEEERKDKRFARRRGDAEGQGGFDPPRVVASGAKQSSIGRLDCRGASAPRNDGLNFANFMET